jgi:hypothetical protein
VVFPEPDPEKVEEIPSQQNSCDFPIAESNRKLALAKFLVGELNAMRNCYDIRSVVDRK